MQWPRRRPHGNEHNEWRSRRSRPDRTLARKEYAAESAVAAFMKEHNEWTRIAR